MQLFIFYPSLYSLGVRELLAPMLQNCCNKETKRLAWGGNWSGVQRRVKGEFCGFPQIPSNFRIYTSRGNSRLLRDALAMVRMVQFGISTYDV
jgi:hypothetical protein